MTFICTRCKIMSDNTPVQELGHFICDSCSEAYHAWLSSEATSFLRGGRL